MKSSLFFQLGHTHRHFLRKTPAMATPVATAAAAKAVAASVSRRGAPALASVLLPTSSFGTKTSHVHRSFYGEARRKHENIRPTPSLPHLAAVTTTAGATTNNAVVAKRSHYSYADGPGRFAFSEEAVADRHAKRLQRWDQRGFTVGIGGPVGSGKTALVLALIRRLGAKPPVLVCPPLASSQAACPVCAGGASCS